VKAALVGLIVLPPVWYIHGNPGLTTVIAVQRGGGLCPRIRFSRLGPERRLLLPFFGHRPRPDGLRRAIKL
jgi:hypothetical protein